eukprot:SRR837773.14444.p1 GENE.SRR837773.14444~~SRR837773.14444.p1  ORF type:complete len:663 (-),score=132.47 SRR837773.14444:76-1815(-)
MEAPRELQRGLIGGEPVVAPIAGGIVAAAGLAVSAAVRRRGAGGGRRPRGRRRPSRMATVLTIEAPAGGSGALAPTMDATPTPTWASAPGDMLEAAARFAGASGEVLVDALSRRRGDAADHEEGWTYKKGVEGMSMGSMLYELLNTPESTEDFRVLRQEFDKGSRFPFANVSLWSVTSSLQTIAQSLGISGGLARLARAWGPLVAAPKQPKGRLPLLFEGEDPGPADTAVEDAAPLERSLEPEAMVVPAASELRRWLLRPPVEPQAAVPEHTEAIDDAYQRCKEVTQRYSKTFFLGSRLLDADEQRAVWAIYTWCRSTDELVDGPRADRTTLADLEAWQARLLSVFQKSHGPVDGSLRWEDLALADTIRRHGLPSRPFEDMVAGMAMDLTKKRYTTFRELEVYCYRVAGAVGLMTLPVLGLDAAQSATKADQERIVGAAVALGLAFQLTNVLRDVGEDARRDRIYLPREDLERFGLSEEDVLRAAHAPGHLHTERRWEDFMEFQLKRCERLYRMAESGIQGLAEANRLGVMTSLYIYRGILDAVRANQYDNFHRRAYVSFPTKVALMAQAWWQLRWLPR